MNCPICDQSNSSTSSLNGINGLKVECKNCGDYTIADSAKQLLITLTDTSYKRWRLSAIVLAQLRPLHINSENLEYFSNKKSANLIDRAHALLREIKKSVGYKSEFFKSELGAPERSDLKDDPKGAAGWVTTPADTKYYSISYSTSHEDLFYLIDEVLIKHLGYLHKTEQNQKFTITTKGNLWLEGELNTDSTQCFVAMSFGYSKKKDKSEEEKNTEQKNVAALNEFYEKGLRLGVENSRRKFTAMRIDRKEHINKIDDEIIAEIRKSRFLIADLTEHKGGVYFEAGFAKGLGLPVIWTCRSDHFGERHFDIVQYNCIPWTQDDLPALARAITARIDANII